MHFAGQGGSAREPFRVSMAIPAGGASIGIHRHPYVSIGIHRHPLQCSGYTKASARQHWEGFSRNFLSIEMLLVRQISETVVEDRSNENH